MSITLFDEEWDVYIIPLYLTKKILGIKVNTKE